ncbi:MAG: beta-galactosidase trimerization domain-containing protein [Armatimonadota bacterium]|nr:beta-galactosidase trimerization domain-containing protein [Armatimonadota bacterium]
MTTRHVRVGATIVLMVASLQMAGAECTVEETTVMGEPAIVLENELVRLRARPTMGGRLDELFYKPAETHLTSRTEGRVFVDRLWNYANADVYRQWTESVYTYTVDRTPARAAITMTGPGSVGPGRFMTFEKTISIEAGSSAVRADYRFGVGQAAMQPLRVGLWWHSRLGVPQEQNTYYVPTTEGVKTASYGAGGGGEYWWYDPARGWSAVAAESGVGVAAITEFPPLMLFYNWMGGDVASLEWAFRSREIPNGSAMETTAWLLPFAEMGRVAGAAREVVVGLGDAPDSIDAPGAVPLTVQLSSPRQLSARVTLSGRRLPDGEAEDVATWSAELKPGQTHEHELSVELPQAGTWVLRGEVRANGERLTDFSHELVVGERSGQIALEPVEERVGRVGERFEDKLAARGTGPEDRPPSEDVVTPHVRWAKPLAGGPVRALIINDLLVGRETVELAQRLEMDYDAPTITTPYAMSATTGMFGKAVNLEWSLDNIRELLEENRYEAILIGGLSAELFPEDIIDAILGQVEDGAGLVWANPNDCSEKLWEALPFGGIEGGSRPEFPWRAERQHYLTVGIPWEALPPTDTTRYTDDGQVLARADRYPLLAVKNYGDGRIVGLGYCTSWQGPGSYSNGLTPWIQFAPTRFDYWEYYHSLLAKCTLWAAGREPEGRIASLSVEPGTPLQGGEAPALHVTLQGAADAVRAQVRIVDEFGSVEHTAQVSLTEGDNAIPLAEDMAGGLHLVDLILRDEQGAVLDWGTATVRVTPRVEVTALEVEDRIYREGDAVQAQVTLEPVEPAPAEVQLVALLRDGYDRLVARETQEAGSSGEASVSIELPEPLATTATLRVEVRDGDRLLDAEERTVLTMPPAWDERTWEPWLAAMWGGPAGAYSREYLADWASQRVKRLGIEAVTTSSNWLHDGEQRNTFEHGFRAIPLGIIGPVLHMNSVRGEDMLTFDEQRELYTKTGEKQYLQRPYTLQAENTRQLVSEKIAEVTEAVARYRPVGYSCGDELSITHYVTPFDYDFSPVALEHFRAWLQERYPSLAALNDQWETDFAAWDEVMPMTAEEVRERGNYAPWADHRTFMEFTMAWFLDFVDGELEAHDPGARVGMSGTQAAEAYGGYDWWRLTDALDFGQTYDHKNTGEMQRSFHDLLTAPWWGYAATDPGLSHRLWRRLLNASDGGSFFTSTYVFWPDYTWTQSTSDALRHLDDIQGGLARLLDGCERQADVLVHYSHPSIHGAWITGGQALFSDNRGGWVQAIEDSGMQVRFLSYQQLEDGELTELMPAAFLLPYSVALSDGEVAEIESYVRSGGTLLADARIGLMDEHCTPRAVGALDELFGVRREDIDPMARRPEGMASFTETMGECDPTSLSFETLGGDTGLSLTTARALGEVAGQPALIVNDVGEGRAVLLNLFLDSYRRRREVGVGEPVRELVAETLRLAGVRPAIDFEVTGDHHLYIARFRAGGAQFVGVLRDAAKGRSEVRLTFQGGPHVYEARTGSYLGAGQTVEQVFEPGQCRIYSLLPYRVEGLRVRLRDAEVAPGDTVQALVSVDGPDEASLHVFRVEVTDPAGQVLEHYGQQLTAPRGIASTELRLALDDAPGTWTIRATDVATGVAGSAELTVGE